MCWSIVASVTTGTPVVEYIGAGSTNELETAIRPLYTQYHLFPHHHPGPPPPSHPYTIHPSTTHPSTMHPPLTTNTWNIEELQQKNHEALWRRRRPKPFMHAYTIEHIDYCGPYNYMYIISMNTDEAFVA